MSLQKSPERLDKQPSEPKVLDFDYAALDAQTRLFVQQRRSEIKTFLRRAASNIFDTRQKLIQVVAVEIRKIYVFGYSAASVLNSPLPVSLATVAKVGGAVEIRKIYVFGCSAASALNLLCPLVWQLSPKFILSLEFSNCFHWSHFLTRLLVQILDNWHFPPTHPNFGQLAFPSYSSKFWTTGIYHLYLLLLMPNQTNFLSQLRYCIAKIEGDSFTIVHLTSMPTAASPKARKGFDYASLDATTSRFVQQQTGEIRALMKRTAQDIVELGQKLIAVKQTIGHGRFEDWLKAEFEWTQMTANRFMNVAKELKSNNLLDLTIAPSALYEIFAPSTSEAAREEALTRAKAGESITYTTAKTIKQKYATPSKPKPEPITQPLPTPPTPASLPQSGSKLEIVAFRPQTQTPVISEAARVIANQAGFTALAPKADQTSSEPNVPGIWWQLGGRHLLYCGDPNSSEFVGQVTEEVSLLFAFPSTPNWQPIMQVNRRFILETLPKDKDTRLFGDTLESILLFCSNIGDVVVSCFLPSSEILSVISRHSRRGVFAEPDSKRVAAVISDWKKAGLKAERLNQR